MKIAMMIKYVKRDGVCLAVVNLAVGLRQLGHEVVVIAGDGPGRDLVEAEKIPLYRAPIDRPVTGWLRAYRDACRWLRQWNADIVHTHYRYANIVGKSVARRLGIPQVSTLNTGRLPDSWLRVKLSCWGDLVFALAQESAQYLTDRFGVSPDRIVVVPPGVDTTRFRPVDEVTRARTRSEFGLTDDDRVIISIGRLAPIKGHHYLIQALARIHRQYPKVRLLIGGEGVYRGELERLVAHHELGSKVLMPGWLDPARVLPTADAFALVSNMEGFAVAAVEAGLSGLAAIRTDVPGARDAVTPGVTGRIVPIGDVDAMTAALEDFAQHPDVWRRMGAETRRVFLEKYDLLGCARKVAEAYERLRSRQPGSTW